MTECLSSSSPFFKRLVILSSSSTIKTRIPDYANTAFSAGGGEDFVKDEAMFKMKWIWDLVIVSLLACRLLFAHPAQETQNSQNGSIALKRAIAVRVTGSIQVDGLLNEGSWQSSPS